MNKCCHQLAHIIHVRSSVVCERCTGDPVKAASEGLIHSQDGWRTIFQFSRVIFCPDSSVPISPSCVQHALRSQCQWLFLACEDFGRVPDHSLPACALFIHLLFKSGDKLMHATSNLLCQDLSTVAQRAEMTVVECSLTLRPLHAVKDPIVHLLVRESPIACDTFTV